MGFSVAPGAYDRFMGRYAARLAPLLADAAGVAPGARVLDVGCGPGALTAELARRTGAARVHAVDPEPAFVAAVLDRLPGVDARLGAAEDLPFADGSVDVALAQLVVPFLADPDRGLREMLRVTRDAGTLAACVWDHAGGTGPLVPSWDAVRDVDPVPSTRARRPVPRPATWSGGSARRAVVRRSRAGSPSRCRGRPSTRGGSRARWGSDPPVPASPLSTRTPRCACASGAARRCPTRPSPCVPRPGASWHARDDGAHRVRPPPPTTTARRAARLRAGGGGRTLAGRRPGRFG